MPADGTWRPAPIRTERTLAARTEGPLFCLSLVLTTRLVLTSRLIHTSRVVEASRSTAPLRFWIGNMHSDRRPGGALSAGLTCTRASRTPAARGVADPPLAPPGPTDALETTGRVRSAATLGTVTSSPSVPMFPRPVPRQPAGMASLDARHMNSQQHLRRRHR
jgi:hypothetical protein